MNIPQKAVAGVGGTTFAGGLVIVILYLFHLSPPPEVVIGMQTVVSGILTGLGVYFTPKED